VIVLLVLALAAAGAAGFFAFREKQAKETVEAELNRLAHHDRLTGLPNRSVLVPWLDEVLTQCRRRSSRVAAVLIDLDRFKAINDTHGPEVGDGLMKAVVARLKTVMRPMDKLVRSAGTQFVVICPDIPDATAAEQLSSRIMTAIQTPFEVGQDLIRMNACIGVTVTNEQSSDVDGVLLDAEVALHKAKDDGAGTIAMFEQSMHSRLNPANAERRLREALERGEFQLLYMPIVSLDTYRMTGVEALIRWKDPERGMISPGEFIPAMEESGLIVSVGAWVLEEACRQARHWREHYPDADPIEVTVNISARQLAQSDFLDVLNHAVAAGGGQASHLCLEVTEGALKFDLDAAWAMLRHTKQIGVSLALDDFGTGSSSIKSVRTFKCDVLKIDKAFIDGLGMAHEDTAIVQHIISLAKDLGMIAVAEGVERPSRWPSSSAWVASAPRATTSAIRCLPG
jgi:diguanylate cyclase (GGDEF)-like protein